jgi:acyl-CoA synthetase (AMP-forming)/AMP-acid ligase II
MRPEFWRDFDETQCTSFAGVPYMYETLDRLRFDPASHGSLKTMTQAGGALRKDLIEKFHARCTTAACRFFVMYGQTEATARIAYVPHERLAEKIGAIGVAIPGGRLSLRELADSDKQELVYKGPNVMMGYAESGADLASGDELRGRLHTGDLARLDADGFYYLTGRLTRIAKLFGRRISLEDVEEAFEKEYASQAAVIEGDGGLRVFLTAGADIDGRKIGKTLALRLSVPPQCVTVSLVPELPRTASGKKDYKALSS